jgi:hypothetical protein
MRSNGFSDLKINFEGIQVIGQTVGIPGPGIVGVKGMELPFIAIGNGSGPVGMY